MPRVGIRGTTFQIAPIAASGLNCCLVPGYLRVLAQGKTAMNDQDLIWLTCLRSLEESGALPDGCDGNDLERGGLIERVGDGWRPTEGGKVWRALMEETASPPPAL